jgi:Flp pilus assembly protein TadD
MQMPATESNPAPTSESIPVMARSRFPVWLIAVLLVLVTMALYWPVTRCDFINLDDPAYVTENPHVQDGLNREGVKWAFCNTEQAAYWAPLMWLSHMLACQIFGLNAWGHHLINVLLHAANTVLVFFVFRQMTRATWRSVVLAALFGLHPLRVESVAWVTERKDVLSTLFWLLTLWAYAKYVEAAEVRNSKSGMWYGAAIAMFVLGLMSKAMLVTVPCVLLLLDYWPLERFKPGCARRLVTEKIPFFALAAVASVVTFTLQKHGGSVASFEDVPLGMRSGNALISYCRYLGKLFWPTDLAVFYPHPGYWPMGKVLLAGVLLCGISVVLFVRRRRYPFLLMGWLWFVGTLVPVIQLVQSGEQAMADRFTYVPSLGVLILTIWGAYELTRDWRCQMIVLSVAGSAAIILCIGLTRQQLGYWKDNQTLYRHALEVTENNYFAHSFLGDALLAKGQIDEAISQYQEAIRLKRSEARSHDFLGIALGRKGQTDEAIRQFQEAIRLKPDDANAHYNLGAALGKKGQTDEAIHQFQEVIRLTPDFAYAHNNLGTVLLTRGQIEEAISQFQEAIRLKPDYVEAHYNLGNAFLTKGQIEEAIRQFQEVIRLKPEYADAHYNLGSALLKKDQIEEAIRQFQEVIRLTPDDAEAHNNLGTAVGRKGQTEEAISQFQEAIRLKPDDAEAQDNLARALKMKNAPAGH